MKAEYLRPRLRYIKTLYSGCRCHLELTPVPLSRSQLIFSIMMSLGSADNRYGGVWPTGWIVI
jgi:hypothetical protein